MTDTTLTRWPRTPIALPTSSDTDRELAALSDRPQWVARFVQERKQLLRSDAIRAVYDELYVQKAAVLQEALATAPSPRLAFLKPGQMARTLALLDDCPWDRLSTLSSTLSVSPSSRTSDQGQAMIAHMNGHDHLFLFDAAGPDTPRRERRYNLGDYAGQVRFGPLAQSLRQKIGQDLKLSFDEPDLLDQAHQAWQARWDVIDQQKHARREARLRAQAEAGDLMAVAQESFPLGATARVHPRPA